MLGALRDAGLEIAGQGKDYVTVRDPDTDKRYRLKGGFRGSDSTGVSASSMSVVFRAVWIRDSPSPMETTYFSQRPSHDGGRLLRAK
jgi:hypothetical protein